jgi:hypothetical protein
MTILLDPPKPDAPSFEIDHQIVVALATLHGALVRIRGAGRFGGYSATILLEREVDAETALVALSSAGIHAAVMSNSQRDRLR